MPVLQVEPLRFHLVKLLLDLTVRYFVFLLKLGQCILITEISIDVNVLHPADEINAGCYSEILTNFKLV